MKYVSHDDNGLTLSSRPARGGWIEIVADFKAGATDLVPPRTGRVD